MYYYLDLKYYIYYYNNFYRVINKVIYNGFFFDKLYIDVILIKLLYISKESYYFNIEAGILQKMIKILVDSLLNKSYKNIKTIVKGFLHVYILIIIFFMISIYIIYVFFFYLNITMFLSVIVLIFLGGMFK